MTEIVHTIIDPGLVERVKAYPRLFPIAVKELAGVPFEQEALTNEQLALMTQQRDALINAINQPSQGSITDMGRAAMSLASKQRDHGSPYFAR